MEPGREGTVELDDRHFAVSSERVDDGEYVRVSGELDLAMIGAVDREMERAEATDARSIVLDLDGLEFLDAAGVRLLLQLNDRSQGNGRRLRIKRAAAPQVQRVLELTGAGEQLPFLD